MSTRRQTHFPSVLACFLVAIFTVALVGCEVEAPTEPADPEVPTEPEVEEDDEVALEIERLEANKDLVSQAIDLISQGDLDELDQYIAEDMVDHNPVPDQPPGLDGVKQWLAFVHESFENYSIEVDELIAEGDLVAIRGTTTFENHREEFMGVPPTGRDATISGFGFFRVEDGMIVERWGVGDMLSLMQQLGVEMEVPEPEHAQRKLVQ